MVGEERGYNEPPTDEDKEHLRVKVHIDEHIRLLEALKNCDPGAPKDRVAEVDNGNKVCNKEHTDFVDARLMTMIMLRSIEQMIANKPDEPVPEVIKKELAQLDDIGKYMCCYVW
jgi:hypothetical protein